MLLNLDFSSETPIYQQIRNEIVLGIASGRLLPGEKLPTTRALALQAGINTMTVSKAYQLLKSEAYIESDRRLGTIVSPAQPQSHRLSDAQRAALRLIIAQAKLNGMSKEEFANLCEDLFEEATR